MKKVFGFLAVLLLLASLPLCAFAEGYGIPQTDGTDKVVDLAELFTPAEEDAMRARIAELTAQSGKDIVIYTDMTSYGMEHRMTAADFYDFNGYGVGPEHDGIILFICMDPEYRGWTAVTTGSVQEIYTQSNASQLDNAIYDYLASGRYAEGVMDWIEHIGVMYEYGTVIRPKDPAQLRAEKLQRSITVGAVVGAVAGLISLITAKSGMKTVRQAVTARGELVSNSFRVRSRDRLDHVSTVTRHIERDDNNNSGGHSSFGGSFSGHSGTSHTSSGGRF